ncbi:SMI1/KNR4 family protein [Rummeliibacillus pycnus]|uniref:SMI1/KNR4 family protein n=1 Tax=Rummeliibacillus pycnus TaxID=101070 RepID=UPI0037CB7FAA
MVKIWANNPEDTYKLKKLKVSDIKKAEKIFGINLPKEYIEILKVQNGGEIIYNAFPSPQPTAWDETSGYIDHIFGIGKDPGILDTPYYIQEWEMPENIVLISGDGSEWIAFDYRHTKINPPIIYINNDSNEIITVADSFNEFISILYTQENTGTSLLELYEAPQTSQQEVEQFIKENNICELIGAIDLISHDIDEMDHINVNWYTDKLIQLSHHNDSDVRIAVVKAAIVLEYLIDKDILNKIINILNNDSDIDVLNFIEILKEKMK